MMAKHRPPWLSRRTMPHSAATKPSSRNRPRSSIQWYACQPRRGVRARNACVTCPPPASSPPTMSSATVRRAGCGMDSTISPTHLPSVAGRPASGRGSMISAGVWCNTRNMGAGRPVAPPHPFQTALTPPGLETPVGVKYGLFVRAARTRVRRFCQREADRSTPKLSRRWGSARFRWWQRALAVPHAQHGSPRAGLQDQVVVRQRVQLGVGDDLFDGLTELVRRQLGAAAAVDFGEGIERLRVTGRLAGQAVKELGNRPVDQEIVDVESQDRGLAIWFDNAFVHPLGNLDLDLVDAVLAGAADHLVAADERERLGFPVGLAALAAGQVGDLDAGSLQAVEGAL